MRDVGAEGELRDALCRPDLVGDLKEAGRSLAGGPLRESGTLLLYSLFRSSRGSQRPRPARPRWAAFYTEGRLTPNWSATALKRSPAPRERGRRPSRRRARPAPPESRGALRGDHRGELPRGPDQTATRGAAAQ